MLSSLHGQKHYFSDTEKRVKQSESFRLSKQSVEALMYIIELSGVNKTAIIEKLLIEDALRLGWKPEVYRRGLRSSEFNAEEE